MLDNSDFTPFMFYPLPLHPSTLVLYVSYYYNGMKAPYWESILQAKANLGHITASVKGHEYHAPLEDGTRGHLPLNGFADGKVIGDARLRLAIALREVS